MATAVQTDIRTSPESRPELHQWVREQIPLSPSHERALLDAIDAVFVQHERLWQQSKQEAIQAVSAGFSERLHRLRDELTDRTHRDPKTRLMNFRRFVEQLEAFLALEQRGRCCAVGLVDIKSFKSFNDTRGHALGDKIIDRVARLLREQVRSDDLIAQETATADPRAQQELHARFGGDEFCFLIPDLDEFSAAWVIAERFREAVHRHHWATEDPRLDGKPVHADIGVVCLLLGPVGERRSYARQLPHELLARADKLMYEAKFHGTEHVSPLRVHVANGALQDLDPDEHPE